MDSETLKEELPLIIKGRCDPDGKWSIDKARWHQWVNAFLNLSEADQQDVQRFVGRAN